MITWVGSAAGASCEEKSIGVDLKRQHNGTQEIQSEDKKADVDVESPSVSREAYNRHMKLISQKLSEEKLRLQNGSYSSTRDCHAHQPLGRAQVLRRLLVTRE